MRELFGKYKSVIRFILTFLGSYFLLALVYQGYLKFGASDVYYPDYITHLVAQQSEAVINAFGYESVVEPHPDEASMKLYINGNYLARVVEGCNAISVMILFVAFIIAFFDTWKSTLLYILAGTALIYGLNIFRIAFLCIGIFEFPEQYHLLHGILFPLVIYGIVFLLWIVWVNRFSRKNTKS